MEGTPSKLCEGRKKPQDHMICNTDPCPIWNFGGWGQVKFLSLELLLRIS